MARLKSLAAPLLIVLSAAGWADREIDGLAAQALKQGHIPGLAIAVIRDGKVIHSKGYGLANLETGTSVTDRTLFEIGSVTKQFCAVAMLMMVEQGAVKLDDKVSRYLDKTPDAWKDVTIRQMLSHTAGLAEYLGLGFNLRKDYSRSELFDFMAAQKMDFAPGESWSYSNAGFALAAMIVEKASGLKWEEFVRQRIFKPLDMSAGEMIAPAKLMPGRANGYAWAGSAHRNSEVMRPMSAFGCGDIVLNVKDFANWAIAMDSGALLKPESYIELWKSVALNTGRKHPYSLGWFHARVNGSPNIQHGGNTYGFSAMISRFPGQKLSVVVLSNLAGQSFEGFARRIAAVYAPELAYQPPKPTVDPDRKLTFRVIDAIQTMLNAQTRSDDLASEMTAMLRTMRGKTMASALRRGLGQIRTLRFCSREDVDGVWEYRYIGVFEKQTVTLALAVTQEGQLVRFGVEGAASLPSAGEN